MLLFRIVYNQLMISSEVSSRLIEGVKSLFIVRDDDYNEVTERWVEFDDGDINIDEVAVLMMKEIDDSGWIISNYNSRKLIIEGNDIDTITKTVSENLEECEIYEGIDYSINIVDSQVSIVVNEDDKFKFIVDLISKELDNNSSYFQSCSFINDELLFNYNNHEIAIEIILMYDVGADYEIKGRYDVFHAKIRVI